MSELQAPELPAEGGCRCGRVRFRVTAPPLVTMACHCRGCQRMSGSAYSLSAAYPVAAFEVTKGEPVIGGLRGEDARHNFCGWCMSWMFTRIRGLDWFVNVRASLLDDPGWYVPFVETCTAEALPWAHTGAPHAYPQFPPMEDFESLLAEYARAIGDAT